MAVPYFFSWCNGSSKKLPRKDPLFRKTYFYAKGENTKQIPEFRRDVYFPIDNPENIAVIHYIGDSTLSVPGPHGNSMKQTKLFCRTKPSVAKKIVTEVEEKAPHKVYKQMIAEHNVINEATDKPRNVKQVQNIKAASASAKRISRDAIMNTHEIAYEENGFIWHITTYPDVAVVMGQKEILELLTEAISWNRSGMLLSYDTTFCLGEFYVSPLLFRCSVFEENPVVPAMFLFHERKHQSVHELFFSIFTEQVKRTAGLPIVVDMEPGIVGAIHGKTSLHLAGCWRHMEKDVSRKLIADGVPQSQRVKIIDDLYVLLRSKSQREYNEHLNRCTNEWSPAFKTFFMDNVNSKMSHFGHWNIQSKFGQFFTENGITTNQIIIINQRVLIGYLRTSKTGKKHQSIASS